MVVVVVLLTLYMGLDLGRRDDRSVGDESSGMRVRG